MKITQKLVTGALAMAAFMPLALMPLQAQAQQYNQQYRTQQTTPRIIGFNVEEVRRLAPGAELNFGLYGTPGGMATLRIAGATRNLSLIETEAGRYEGIYIISVNDKIEARSQVIANLRIGNQVVSAVLNESLQTGAGARRAQARADRAEAALQPKIEQFNVVPAADYSRGQDLHFTVLGSSGGKVDLTIDGVRGKILLPEVNKGVYATSYTIHRRDRITDKSVVTANLVLNERTTSAKLGKPLQSTVAPPARAARICHDCGTVEAVNRIEVQGDGGYLGTIGGGVIGALLGNQVGGGSGKTAATIAGAVGGAFAGRAIEANSRATQQHFEVVVRMQSGTAQTVLFEAEPNYRVGEKVKITDGVLARNP